MLTDRARIKSWTADGRYKLPKSGIFNQMRSSDTLIIILWNPFFPLSLFTNTPVMLNFSISIYEKPSPGSCEALSVNWMQTNQQIKIQVKFTYFI